MPLCAFLWLYFASVAAYDLYAYVVAQDEDKKIMSLHNRSNLCWTTGFFFSRTYML